MTAGGAPEANDPLVLLDRMDEAFYAIDRDFRFTLINRRAEAFWGRPRDEMVGHTMLELFPHFENSEPYAAHVRAMQSAEPVRVETVSTANGLPVEIRLYPGKHGLSVYFTDISLRRQLELDLRARDELLSLAELSAGIGVWTQDLSTHMMTATPQFFRLLGIDPIEGPVPQDFVRSFRHPADRERVVSQFEELLAQGEETFESEYRVVRPNGDIRWIFGRGRVTRDAAGVPRLYSGVDLDITERRQQQEHLRVVMGELLHRSNNLLTVVQGLAQQTVRGSKSLEDFVPTFSARLQGLSQSSTLLAREDWRGALLGELVRAQVKPFAAEQRFELSGPPVRLSPKAVQNLGLALHELCTNAVKYGALSVPAGHVRVAWRIEGEGEARSLHVDWAEIDGPAVTPPTRKGFGRVVAEQILANALAAEVESKFEPAGLKWRLSLPAAEFAPE